jgi:tetratricopeptide (TPR) repeat protein
MLRVTGTQTSDRGGKSCDMRYLCSLAVLILLFASPVVGQSTSSSEQAESHVRELVAEGTRLFAEGNYSAALDEFRQAHGLAPEDVEAIIGLAHAEALHADNSGNLDMQTQAAADYRAAIARQPTAELYAELGAILDAGKDYAAAITAYRKALALNPEFLMAQVNYGSALVSIGDPDSAISFFSKVCARSHTDNPGTGGSCGDVRLVGSRGWAYFAKGDCPSLSLAEKDYSEAVSLTPENAGIHSVLGDVLSSEGGMGTKGMKCAHNKHEREAYLDRAWSQYRSALNLDSANTMYREMFVLLSEVLKRKPEYNGGIAKEPDKAELSQMLAKSQPPVSSDSLESLESSADAQLSAEHNKALADAKEAVRADPSNGTAWVTLGQAYLNLGDYKNAEEATKKAIEIFTERFKNPKPPTIDDLLRGRDHDEQRTNLSMLASSYVQLAIICRELHKKREAARYDDLALRTFDLLQPSHAASPPPQQRGNALPPPPPRPALTLAPPLPQCQLPMHELCQYPTFHPQPYDPNQPYRAPDTRDYDRCVLGNQREDARYQQCVQR